MRDWARSFPIKAEPDDPILQAHEERNAEMRIWYAAGLKRRKLGIELAYLSWRTAIPASLAEENR